MSDTHLIYRNHLETICRHINPFEGLKALVHKQAYCISSNGLDWTGLDWTSKTPTGETRTSKSRSSKTRTSKTRTSKSRTSKTQQNTVEALVSDHLGNSEKWSQLKRPRGKTIEDGRLGKLLA